MDSGQMGKKGVGLALPAETRRLICPPTFRFLSPSVICFFVAACFSVFRHLFCSPPPFPTPSLVRHWTSIHPFAAVT